MKIVCLKKYLVEPLQQALPNIQILTLPDHEAEILIAEPSDCISTILDEMKNLKFIQCSRAGYDQIDMEYIKQRKISFCNAKGLYSVPIAEDIVNKILIFTNHTLDYLNQKKDKVYKPIYERTCLSSLCVGFLGTGSIALKAAERLASFGCEIIGYKRSKVDHLPHFDSLYYGKDLTEFLKKVDILVITLDLNAETYHMINAETIASLKDGAALINVSRGQVIDEKVLIDALKNGKISYAGLDVFEEEPLPAYSELWDLPMVYLTPHASGICKENHDRLFELTKQNIMRYLNGELLINKVF